MPTSLARPFAPDMGRVSMLTSWSGFCGGCGDGRPLLLSEHGARGLRAWLCGLTPADRTLTLTCGLCGSAQRVPATEQLDEAYDRTLPRWPDVALEPAVATGRLVALPPLVLDEADSFVQAARAIAAAEAAPRVPLQAIELAQVA